MRRFWSQYSVMGTPLTSSMTKYGRPLGGFAAVEDFGDVGVIHEGQGLAFGFEAGDDLAGVHAGLDELEGDFAADGLVLLGDVDEAHAAFADLFHELVGADDGARASRGCGDVSDSDVVERTRARGSAPDLCMVARAVL